MRDLDPDVVWLRTSLGRHREESALQGDDEALVRVSLLDLAAIAGIHAQPVDTHVQRLSARLGLTTETDPVKIEYDLNPLVRAGERGALSLRLIQHDDVASFYLR